MKLDAAPLMNPAILQKGLSEMQMARINEASQDFEAMFVTEMMRPMFDTVEVDETFGGGKGEEIFRGFMLEEYGKQMASVGTLGISDLVKAQMIEMQSAANASVQGAAMAQNMHKNPLADGAASDAR